MFQIYHDNVASVAGTAITGLMLYVFGRHLSRVSLGSDCSPPPCKPAGILKLLNNLSRIPSDESLPEIIRSLSAYKIMDMVVPTSLMYVASYFIMKLVMKTAVMLHYYFLTAALWVMIMCMAASTATTFVDWCGLYSTNSVSVHSPLHEPDGVVDIPEEFSFVDF